MPHVDESVYETEKQTGDKDEQRSARESPSSATQEKLPAHQRFVFTDPAAFRYLEEDPSVTVLERRRKLPGYELYVVEQWACSRVHPTFVITTYTGFEQHSVLVSVLSVPTDEATWSPRLKVYFKAITKYHARKKDTPLGTLMVTNLSGFPSALTVIQVPDGDLKAHREDFMVNENLKRMGCAGRAGLNLSPPVQATEAKFNRLYRTSDRIPLFNAVIELVKLCQAALMLFGKLAPEYADGLLCDVTEQAISDWWNDIGTEILNVEPTDGKLGPTTVAALLGLLLGSRNRLHAFGAPVAKDAFDIVSTKRGIGYFQKSQKLQRTRRLDLDTIRSLRKATAKSVKSSEGWNVPRAVKSTVAELSGKGNDLVIGEAREKASIADIESIDMETFVKLASGERSKWLWHGKPRKTDSDVFKQLGGDDGMIFENDEHGGFAWSKKQRDSVVDDHPRYGLSDRIYTQSAHGSAVNVDPADKDVALRRTVLKSVTGRMTDARSGFGRIRDAVGIRGHHSRFSKEAMSVSDGESLRERPFRISDELRRTPDSANVTSSHSASTTAVAEGSVISTPPSPRSRRGSSFVEEPIDPVGTTSRVSYKTMSSDKYATWENAVESESEDQQSGNVSDVGQENMDQNIRNSTFEPKDLAFSKPKLEELENIERDGHTPFRRTKQPLALQRTTSAPQIPRPSTYQRYQYRWPRHLSFSIVVDVISSSDDIAWSKTGELDAKANPDTSLAREKSKDFEAQRMDEHLSNLKTKDGIWVEQRVGVIEDIDAQRGRDKEVLDVMYRQKLEEYHALQEASDDLLAEEKASLGEAAKDIETLGAKLEYELNALESKVEDVENAVAEFERQVTQVEWRADELRLDATDTRSWLWWPLRLFAGSNKAAS